MSQTAKTHSIIGCISCVIALGMLLIFLLSLLSYNYQLNKLFGDSVSDDLALLQITTLMLVTIPVHLVGLSLGIISVFFPNRKKLFPVLGIILNFIFGCLGLIPYFYIAFYSLGRVQ